MSEEGQVSAQAPATEVAAATLDTPVQGTNTQTGTTDNGWGLIPEDLRKMTEISKYEKGGVPALAKGYVEMFKLDSGKVRIPTKPEEWVEFNKKIGVPEKPDDYKVKAPVLTDDDKRLGINYSPDLEKAFREVAHKTGYRGEQVQAAIDFQMNMVRQGMIQQEAEIKKLNDGRWEKQKKEWGETKTTENIEFTKRAFNEFAPEELKEIMTVDDAIKDPLLVKMYSTIWRKVADDTMVRGTQTQDKEENPSYPKSPEIYRNNPKWKEWFIKRGYDYATGTWRTA